MLTPFRESNNNMLSFARVFRLCSSLHPSLASHERHVITVIRQPLRFLDADGHEVKHPHDIVPDPMPVQQKTADKQPNRKKQKQGNNRRQSSTSNAASLEFIKSITEITSRLSHKKGNLKELIVLEGEKLICDAFNAGIQIQKLYHDKDLSHYKKLRIVDDKQVKITKVDRSDMVIVSKLSTPPGLMAIAKKPSVVEIEMKRPQSEVMPVVTIGDTITEPGNVGGLLRSMAASGAATLILSEQSACPWDVKVLRSGVGAHFLVPIRTLSSDRIHAYLENMSGIFYADNSSNPVTDEPTKSYHEVSYFKDRSNRVALFLGSEAHGFCPEVRQILKERNAQRIVIPMSSQFDSLNNYVAASVILFEMRNQYDKLKTDVTSQ